MPVRPTTQRRSSVRSYSDALRRGRDNRRRRSRSGPSTTLTFEPLEDRNLLAVVLPSIGGGSIGGGIAAAGLEAVLSEIPASSLNLVPADDISVVYHAFPQEVNNVKASGSLLNMFLFVDEQSDDVLLIRALPAFNDALLEDFNFTLEFIAGIEIPVMHLLGLDFPSVDAIVPNPEALSIFVPQPIREVAETAADVLDTAIFPKLKVFGKTIIPGLTVEDLIKTPAGPVMDILTTFIDILAGGDTGGVQMHLMDGDDQADLGDLSGVSQWIHGGLGDDVLIGGGTDDPLTVLGSSPLNNINPRIELHGDEGADTFIVNRGFNVDDYRVFGGSGNDALVVPGTDGNDIFRITFNSVTGTLETIEFLAPDASGGISANEVQTVALPPATNGGTFTLTFGGKTTGDIAFNASSGVVAGKLNALDSIAGSGGSVSVTGPDGGPWDVEFTGSLAGQEQLNMAINGGDLTVQGGKMKVDETLVGASTTYDEVQRISIPSGSTGGTFRLTDGAETTDPIDTTAGSGTLRTALATLNSIGSRDNLKVSRFEDSSSDGWIVEFVGDLADTDPPELQATDVRLTGYATGATSATELTKGVPDVNEIQTLHISGYTGTFKLEFEGFVTDPIPYNASAFVIENLLEELPSIGGDGNIDVIGVPGDWIFEFTGEVGGANQPLLAIDSSGLAPVAPFPSIVISEIQAGVAGIDEVQEISIDPSINGGQFTLDFGGIVSNAIAHNASAEEVESALEYDLRELYCCDANVTVSGAAPTWTVTFVDDLGATDHPEIGIDQSEITKDVSITVDTDRAGNTLVNEVQTISPPPFVTGGTFRLSFDGSWTGDLNSDESAAGVETALNGILSGGASVSVSGPDGGPWEVEFQGTLAGIDVTQEITADGDNLVRKGIEATITERTTGCTGGETPLVTTTFTEMDSIEELRIDGGDGDDTLIVVGAPADFAQGVSFSGSSMHLISTNAAPSFSFEGGTVVMDGGTFACDGSITLDAAGNSASASLSGTGAGDEIRFAGAGAGGATFARAGKATVTLQNFAAGSQIELLGHQGDDVISIALEGTTEFVDIHVDGGGPRGVDALRFEGTTGTDTFEYTPDMASTEAGNVTVGNVNIDFVDAQDVSFVGLGGHDTLTVNEPQAASNDTILFNPQVGNDGSFQCTSQPGGPDTAMVYPAVAFQSIEDRIFNTGAGTDTLSIASDDLPGVNSSASVVGGAGTTRAAFGDQSTTFIHDTADKDLITLEIGTVVDDVTVTPGQGIDIGINTGLGSDLLTYLAGRGNIGVRVADNTITQTGHGDVTYTSAETVAISGANNLTLTGTPLDDEFLYRPDSPDSGRISLSGRQTGFAFDNLSAILTIAAGPPAADEVIVEGTDGNDLMVVDAVNRTVAVTDSAGTALKPVTLDTDVELVTANGRSGDDEVLVVPGGLPVQIDGGWPNASDRVVVVDEGPGNVVRHHQGPDGHSGSVIVGSLEPVEYDAVERVDILPADPITGGAGNDGAGRIVVFHADLFEQNDNRLISTEMPDLGEFTAKASINPGGQTDPFGTGLDLPGDEDWYRFRARKSGTLDIQVLFEEIATLSNGQPGLPDDGNLDIFVYDIDGQLIVGNGPNFGTNDGATELDVDGDSFNEDERIRMPVVAGQTYFLRVVGVGQAINSYNMRVENTPPPVPFDLELDDNPANGTTNLPGQLDNSDTGRSQFDNIMYDNTPMLYFRLDDAFFLHDLPSNVTDDTPPDEVIPIPFQAGPGQPTDPGFAIAIFDEGDTGTQTAQDPQTPLGFAWATVDEGVYTFTTPVLSDGSHFLTARVQMIDPAAPTQTGFGARSQPLEIVVDTQPPPVFFGYSSDPTDGIDPASTDTGVEGYPVTFIDRVTSDTTTGFFGTAEADSLVRLYVDQNGDGVVDAGDVLLGETVAIPLDGTNQFPNGQWRLDTTVDLNDPDLFAFDGLRRLLLTAEDVAGNLSAPESLNIFIDTQGPQVTDVEFNQRYDPYDVFDPKPSTDGPTPLVYRLVISVQDLPNRSDVDPNFLYDAFWEAVAEQPGHYQVVGDANGAIPIQSVDFIPDVAQDGVLATGVILIEFFEPLPDDRFTLTLSDTMVDPAGNALDGETNTVEPHETPLFPSGDGQPGGDFVARFTVDTRPEIGAWSAGSVYVDTNGNFLFDPQNLDYTNRDIVYTLGFTSDDVFVGNFAANPGDTADGFDKLAAYGLVDGSYRWMVDTDNDGVPNVIVNDPKNINGLPVAGEFDGNPANGDEVGLFTGEVWWLDTDHDFTVDSGYPGLALPGVPVQDGLTGYPIVGDFDGDGLDDLGTWTDDAFRLDFANNGFGLEDTRFTLGMIGVRERPVAADMDQDGIDDLGLWIPDRSGATPEESGEWYFLVSDGRSIVDRLVPDPRDSAKNIVDFTPIPFGMDVFAQFGDDFAVPLVGNFDPPVTRDGQAGAGIVRLNGTSGDDVFQFSPGLAPGSWIVRVNDVLHDVGAGTITVELDGLEGQDTVSLTGTDRDDLAQLWPGRCTLSGDGYTVTIANAEAIIVDGGGGTDVAKLYGDPDGKDIFKADPQGATLSGDGYSNDVASFHYVHAYATEGGGDSAELRGSENDDKFKSVPDDGYAKMYGDSLYVRAKFFDTVDAYSMGGNDLARMFGSPGNDTFEGRKDSSRFHGDTFDVTANNFSRVFALAGQGGYDISKLTDSVLKDELHAKPHKTELFDMSTDGSVYKITARGFDRIHAEASEGGFDKAKLWDTSGDDLVEARGDQVSFSTMRGELEMLYDILAFESVKARGFNGGNNTSRAVQSSTIDLTMEGTWDE